MTDYKKKFMYILGPERILDFLGMHFDAAVGSICHEVFNFIQIGPVHTV